MHGVFHRNRVGLALQRCDQRFQPALDRARRKLVALAAGAMHVGAQPWRHIGHDRDRAHAARAVEGERRGVMPRKLQEILAGQLRRAFDAAKVAGGVLDADDGREGGKPAHCVGQQVDTGAAWHIVENDRDGRRLRDGGEVAVETLLARSVVIGRDDERRIRAAFGGGERRQDRFQRAVRAGTGDDRYFAGNNFHRAARHREVLVRRQRRRLAGGAADRDAVYALVELPANEEIETGHVDRSLAERCRQGRDGALEARSVDIGNHGGEPLFSKPVPDFAGGCPRGTCAAGGMRPGTWRHVNDAGRRGGRPVFRVS